MMLTIQDLTTMDEHVFPAQPAGFTPIQALERLCEVCRLSFVPSIDTALITRIKMGRVIPIGVNLADTFGWEIGVETMYEGTLQEYCVFIHGGA